jgi:predicted protein tyrosine phosphatase
MNSTDLEAPKSLKILFANFEGIETEVMRVTYYPASPLSCDVCGYQYCFLVSSPLHRTNKALRTVEVETV